LQGACALLGQEALLGLVAAVLLCLLALLADQALLLFAVEALAQLRPALDAICGQVAAGDARATALLLRPLLLQVLGSRALCISLATRRA
jgi:hypothetical protein